MRKAWVSELASKFDLEKMNTPTLNRRGGFFYIMDGQHTVEVLKIIGYADQQIECWIYEDFTEQEEAEMFLVLNDRKNVATFEEFRISIEAGRLRECDIDRIVRAQNMTISQSKREGSIGAVAALGAVYDKAGPRQLARTIGVVRDAYGTVGFQGQVIEGIGLCIARYSERIDDLLLTTRLGAVRGGVNGLVGHAEIVRRQTGAGKVNCVAAATVFYYNSGRGGKKLPPWWSDADQH